MKVCSSCRVEKSAASFYKKTLSKDGLHSYCKACTSQKNKDWVNNNKQKQAESCAKWYQNNRAKSIAKGTDWYYRNTHGISHEEFLALAEKQSNKCLICSVDLTFAEKTKTRAVLDHNHDTGEIRGVLCNTCNAGIGLLKDNPDVLLSAYHYLKGNTNA